MFKKLLFYYYTTALLFTCISCSGPHTNSISLAGEWQVQLDSLDRGIKNNWAGTNLQGTPITLPGTLDEAGIGTPNTLTPALNNYVLSNLARKHQYIGKAWYQKEIEIPDSWSDKQIQLILERVLWESKVFVDGEEMGTQESLSAEHQYDLSAQLTPGKHLLTIRIDNSNKYPLINVPGTKYPDPVNQDMAHAYTNHTQVKWNGILGAIQLEVKEPLAPTNLQVYPDLKRERIAFQFQTSDPELEKFKLEIVDNSGKVIFSNSNEEITKRTDLISLEVKTPEIIKEWDEFNPNVYTARVIFKKDTIQRTFGYREIVGDSGTLALNGKRIFLRGNLECAIFPLTGHPPMEKEAWAELIRQAKNYGLNHLRFHSWCPPQAAFKAADEAGFYLQVELPHWSLRVGEDAKTTEFLTSEANKILKAYGNHPSFAFMALGNELQGDVELMNTMVKELKIKDPRHLYATTAFSFEKPMGTRPEPEDEFFVSQWTEKGWLRGQGIFNDKPPHFDKDYTENSAHIKIPLISHEIGQYSVYPDLSEIPKYTGVLTPLNFIAVKNDLKQKGLLEQAGDFTQASGKLAAMLYKEEIERALKTPGYDGFQLLQLQDFPGQGTALVGLLNAFWESKGIISGEDFQKFNSEVVPLLRFEKAVYESGETFKANIEIANFYKMMEGQTVAWSIKNEQGMMVKQGQVAGVQLPIGTTQVQSIEYPIQNNKAERLTVEVLLQGTNYQNDWPIWTYPKKPVSTVKDVLITTSFKMALDGLQNGKKVLLNPKVDKLIGVEGRFVPVFWSPVHFPDQPGTMGLLMDNKHKAFQHFPTKMHTEWQWWDLCKQSRSVVLDAFKATPIVQVIDNFVTNRKLAMIFEAKVGEGKLLFSATDLTSDLNNRPVARQLRYSLLEYMKSEDFDPKGGMTSEEIKMLIHNENK